MEEDQENTKMFITTEIEKKGEKEANGGKTSRFEGKMSELRKLLFSALNCFNVKFLR